MVAQGGCNTSIEDWFRAPFVRTFPLRYKVTQVVVRRGTVTWPTHLWAAMPIYRGIDGIPILVPHTFGRRTIDLPELACLAATWDAAMAYATAGSPPRPLADVYPEWCGIEQLDGD